MTPLAQRTIALAEGRQLEELVQMLEKDGATGLSDHEMRLDRQLFRVLDRYLRLRALRTPL